MFEGSIVSVLVFVIKKIISLDTITNKCLKEFEISV